MTSSKDHRTADRLERWEAQAMVDGDLATLAVVWGDELVITPPGGPTADKPTALGLVGSGRLAYRSVDREVLHVVATDHVLVSMGVETVTGVTTEEAEVRRYTHVWFGEGEDWRLVARHASPATASR